MNMQLRFMSNNNPKNIKKNIESVGAPRQLNGSQDVSSLGTNASGTPVSSKPKKN